MNQISRRIKLEVTITESVKLCRCHYSTAALALAPSAPRLYPKPVFLSCRNDFSEGTILDTVSTVLHPCPALHSITVLVAQHWRSMQQWRKFPPATDRGASIQWNPSDQPNCEEISSRRFAESAADSAQRSKGQSTAS